MSRARAKLSAVRRSQYRAIAACRIGHMRPCMWVRCRSSGLYVCIRSALLLQRGWLLRSVGGGVGAERALGSTRRLPRILRRSESCELIAAALYPIGLPLVGPPVHPMHAAVSEWAFGMGRPALCCLCLPALSTGCCGGSEALLGTATGQRFASLLVRDIIAVGRGWSAMRGVQPPRERDGMQCNWLSSPV